VTFPVGADDLLAASAVGKAMVTIADRGQRD
jgi:hypothetical protein